MRLGTKTAAIVSAALALALGHGPARAGTVTSSDGSGVDKDAACKFGSDRGPNYVVSPWGQPGGTLGVPAGGDGCSGISTYDGSTETTDFSNVTLSTSGTKLAATFDVDGNIPPAGYPALNAADLPDISFNAFGFRLMYQNTTRQTNTPYVAATRLTGTPIFGLNEHWGDGFHKFVAFDAVWVGHWIHIVSVGTYDPGPDGGFYFDELGVNHGAGWITDDPCMPHGTTWDVAYPTLSSVTVTVDGVTRRANTLALGGCINDEYVKPGDSIVNIKGMSTAGYGVTSLVTVPLSLIPGFGNLHVTGRVEKPSDYTPGNSRNVGLVGSILQPNHLGQPFGHGVLGLVDTLGDGPRCWTATFGGLFPSNPLWVANQPCYIDDNVIPGPSGNIDPGLGRGAIFEEWWDTNYGFTA